MKIEIYSPYCGLIKSLDVDSSFLSPVAIAMYVIKVLFKNYSFESITFNEKKKCFILTVTSKPKNSANSIENKYILKIK
jgi:hypothetical protein